MTVDPDLEDLLAWQAGDKQAGARLVSKHHDMIYRFFDRKIGQDVSDLVQETFEACLVAKDEFQQRSTFRTFLFGIARNKYLGHLRSLRTGINNPIISSFTSLADFGISPTQLLHEREESRFVYEALRRLPLDHQILLELHYWERLTGPELAQVFCIPENTVRSRLRKAKTLLRNTLESLSNDPVSLKSTLHDLDDLVARLREEARERFPEIPGRPDDEQR